jgi:hypothetical protein
MAGRVATRNALHHVAEDLVPVRGERHHQTRQRAPGAAVLSA